MHTAPAQTRFILEPSPIPGVEVRRIAREPGANGVVIDLMESSARIPPAERDATDRHWANLCAKNPRLYSGPLLSVALVDDHRATIHCRRDEFKRLAVQPTVRTGVQVLSVTGVVTARNHQGREHVLLGRRGRQTRVYPGLWELGPAGGIPPPHASIGQLNENDAVTQLIEEGAEELGISLDRRRVSPALLYTRDTVACSDDLVFRIAWDETGSMEDLSAELSRARASHAWEYEETRWVAVDEVAAFDAAHAKEIIITTRAEFRGLGWIW